MCKEDVWKRVVVYPFFVFFSLLLLLGWSEFLLVVCWMDGWMDGGLERRQHLGKLNLFRCLGN